MIGYSLVQYRAVVYELPVLVSIPVLVASANLAVSDGLWLVVTTVGFLSSSFLSVLWGCQQKNWIKLTPESRDLNVISDKCNVNTLIIWGALVMIYLASTMLTVNRTSVMLLGLYLNPFNLYTMIMFLWDVCFNPEFLVLLVMGYVGVVVGFKLLSGSDFSNVNFELNAGVNIFIGILGFIVSLEIPFSAVMVNLLASVVLLVSLNTCHVKISHINPFLISLFSLICQYFTDSYLSTNAFIDLMIPLIVKLNHSSNLSHYKITSVIKELLSHSDTRAIFNFLLLNTSFMFVQLIYSFRSGSLGLFSDSLHMALDCSSLALGLVAGVLLKSEVDKNGKFPFGYSRFETLAGFTNGTLLIGISGGIVFEACNRLYNPTVLNEVTELIVVSIAGLIVNLVGIFAFNHGHGHGHSHGHSHSHSHSHSHDHDHDHDHSHNHSHSHDTNHSNDSMNDNMKGIFLHILSDTLGSVGVVISTILTKIYKWDGFDPLVSIIIAGLIFVSAIPLIESTGSSLLLKLNSKNENKLRLVLKEILQIKGIKSFTTPRFWPQSTNDYLTGYIHIQIYGDENYSYIKKQCERLFQKERIDVMIQAEYDYDDCWCRHKSGVVI